MSAEKCALRRIWDTVNVIHVTVVRVAARYSDEYGNQ